MALRQIGIRGYVGEAIVKEWLYEKFPISKGYKIVYQIIPEDVPKKGGGYLDFAVVKGDIVNSIYEVKTQDYILDKSFRINEALMFMWNNKGRKINLISQDKEKYTSDVDTKSYLILLVPPNSDGINNIGINNLNNILLLEEIFDELGDALNKAKTKIRIELFEDLEKEIENLKNPTQGITFRDDFIKKRTIM